MNDDNHNNNLNTNNHDTTNQKTPAGARADAITYASAPASAPASASELTTIQTNMIKARQLLKAALLLEQKESGHSLPTSPRLEESETMARFAFIMLQPTSVGQSSCHMNNNTRLEHSKELEDVLNYMAEQGQEAVYQHQQIVFSNSFGDENEGEDDEADSGNKTVLLRDSNTNA